MAFPSSKDFQNLTGSGPGRSLGKLIAWGFGAIVLLILVFGSTYVVDQGRYGVVTRWGQITNITEPGLHFKLPIVDDVTEISGSLQTVEVANTAVSRDIQQVQTHVNVQYQLPPSVVKQVYVNYRGDLKLLDQAIVIPGIQTATKATTSKYTAEQLITKREEVQDALKDSLARHLKATGGLVLVKVDITDFSFSQDFTKAIEDNVVAERAVKTAQQQFEKKRVLAQQVVTDAKAEADALRLRADAEAYAMKKQNENATELTVKLREAEAKIMEAEAKKLMGENWKPNVVGGTSLVQADAGTPAK